MVFTIHRYIFREVFKVFILTVVALTLILSLGSVLRPVEEYGVGPRQVMHLMIYFLPVTLTFILPMSALFATSLVYGRLAGDNELNACRASGISLLTLIYPGAILSIIVAIASLLLSFHVMPAFFKRAESALKSDAKQILFRNIERTGYYEPPGTGSRIYAERAVEESDSLFGVVIAEVEGSGIKRIVTARRARVHFTEHENFNEVHIKAYDTYQIGRVDEIGFSARSVLLSKQFPSLLGDDIKFKKIGEMKRISQEPIRFYPIEKNAQDVFAQLTTELLYQDIKGQMSSEAEGFYVLHSGDRLLELSAGQCYPDKSEGQTLELQGDVRVREFDLAIEGGSRQRRLLRRLHSDSAIVRLEGQSPMLTVTVELRNPSWQRVDGGEGLAQRVIVRGLLVPDTVLQHFREADMLSEVERSEVETELNGEVSGRLNRLMSRLDKEIHDTIAEIKAEIHTRLVFGIGCIPMILIGIGLGIIKKGGHPLSAFGTSCVPAVVLVVCMLMGKNLTKNPAAGELPGITLIWAGFGILTVLVFLIYHKLLRVR